MPLFSTQFGSRNRNHSGGGASHRSCTWVCVVGYVEWSSDAAVGRIYERDLGVSSDRSNEVSTPVQSPSGRTGCPQGNRKLPTQVMPLP